MCIPVSDLRKGNLVRTEHGILPVHHLVFGDVYVLGKDQRVLYAREVKGVDFEKAFTKSRSEIIRKETGLIFIHEFQNWFYWTHKKIDFNITLL